MTEQTAPNVKCTCALSWRTQIGESEPHAEYCAVANPVRGAMWQGILATVEALPREIGGASRTRGEYSEDGLGGSALKSTCTIAQQDGSEKVYEIAVTVQESVNHNDWYWGPGGNRDGDDVSKRVVVDGWHYIVGTDKPELNEFRGFSGRRFDIEFFDGRKVTTRNLWSQGQIPPKWRERYPDNARFVQPEGGAR